jgi:hypothetical protein
MNRLLISLTLIFILISGVCGCGGEAGIGDVASGDIWETTVVSVITETSLEGEYGGIPASWTAEEGYSFLVAEVLIKNISTEKQWVRLGDISITDSEGQLYVAEGYGGERLDILQGYGEDFFHMPTSWMTAVSAAGELSIKFVFTVPVDAGGFHFMFYNLPEIDLGQ